MNTNDPLSRALSALDPHDLAAEDPQRSREARPENWLNDNGGPIRLSEINQAPRCALDLPRQPDPTWVRNDAAIRNDPAVGEPAPALVDDLMPDDYMARLRRASDAFEAEIAAQADPGRIAPDIGSFEDRRGGLAVVLLLPVLIVLGAAAAGAGYWAGSYFWEPVASVAGLEPDTPAVVSQVNPAPVPPATHETKAAVPDRTGDQETPAPRTAALAAPAPKAAEPGSVEPVIVEPKQAPQAKAPLPQAVSPTPSRAAPAPDPAPAEPKPAEVAAKPATPDTGATVNQSVAAVTVVPATAIAVPAPAPKAAPALSMKPPPAIKAADAEASKLVGKGRAKMADGDLKSARALFMKALPSGLPEAALALGRSFDPAYIARIANANAPTDAAKAREWYSEWYRLGVARGVIAPQMHLDRLLQAMVEE